MAARPKEFAEELQVIETCWQTLQARTLVKQTWPHQEAITGEQALLRWAPEAHERLAMKHALIQRFGVIPIAAVVGLLNSGKSSLTASLLSEASRRRVLRGVGKYQGSQRFTLWIPHVWHEDKTFYGNLTQLLERVFKKSPEMLERNEAAAQKQQNDLASLTRPLIATDEQLSKHRLAIFDCPDIQRAQADHARTRLEMVSRAAEICAAVFVVFARNQIEIRELQAILDRMPDAQRIYAINLLRDEPAAKVRQEAATILNLSSGDKVYAAYDFLANAFSKRTPAWDPNLSRDPDERLERSQPCFFEIAVADADNESNAVEQDRSLLKLADTLTPHALESRRIKELCREFFQNTHDGLNQLEAKLEEQGKGLRDASNRLLDECQGLMTQDGSIRITMRPEIVHSVEQSLTRTAPKAYKWLLLPPRRFLQACGKLLEKARQFSPMPGKELREKKAAIQEKWQSGQDSKIAAGMVSPQDLQRSLSLWSGATGDYQPPERWKTESEAILSRFLAEDKTNLTDAEWDRLTSKLWKQLPGKARLRLATSALLMLGGVLLAFVDGGVSLVTLHAMDVLGGIGVLASLGMNVQSAKELQAVLEEKLGLHQLANFHAIVCDAVGVPREAGDASLPQPSVETALASPSYGVKERGWTQHTLDHDCLTKLRSYGF